MKRTIIILGGGKGLRMGAELPKQFIPLRGKPILMHTIDIFYRWDPTIDIVLVIPEEYEDYWKMLCEELHFTVPHRLAYGGETRFQSVQNGLKSIRSTSDPSLPPAAPSPLPPAALSPLPPAAPSPLPSAAPSPLPPAALSPLPPAAPSPLPPAAPSPLLSAAPSPLPSAAPLIAVHDGVRPFVTAEVISTCFEMAEAHGAAIPVLPMIDTTRITDGDENHAFDRSRLRIVQTPQIFHADILHKAYEQPYNKLFTDDASYVEATGHPIYIFEGNLENVKITTPVDIQYAKILIETFPNS